MSGKILTAESIIFVGLRLDRAPVIMTEEQYTKTMLAKFMIQKLKNPDLEFEYERAIDKIKRRIEAIERFCFDYEEDYRVDFIKMVGINMARMVAATEEQLNILLQQQRGANVSAQQPVETQNLVSTDKGMANKKSSEKVISFLLRQLVEASC